MPFPYLSMSLSFCLLVSIAGPCQPSARGAAGDLARERGELEVLEGGTARAVGVVEANEKHCVVDAQCWLVLDLGEAKAKVIYVEVEGIPTVNKTAADRGFAAEPGDLVEVYGALRKTAAGPELSTVAHEDYYIRPLRSSVKPSDHRRTCDARPAVPA